MAASKEKKLLKDLYEANFDSLYRYIRFKVNSDAIAEDICSEAFVRAFENFQNFRKESSFKTWLYTIARNLIIDWYKEKEKKTSYTEDIGLSRSDDPEFENTKNEAIVRKLIGSLKENYQKVLELRFISRLTIKETAEVLGISVNNVKVTQLRALKKARKTADELDINITK